MFNSTPEPEQRRRVVNEAGLNGFLTKMYGFVGLSVFVSAISSFLVMTTFRAAVFGYFTQHTGMMWLLLLLPIALSMGISASATRNPTGSFIMLMVLSIMYGVEFALLAGVYTGADITAALFFMFRTRTTHDCFDSGLFDQHVLKQSSHYLHLFLHCRNHLRSFDGLRCAKDEKHLP